jgi:hypothetical protein
MNDLSHLGGWIHDPDQVDQVCASLPHPLFSAAAPHLEGSGYGGTFLIYKAYKEANGGEYIDYPAQTIGDCVSHGHAHGVDLLECIRIVSGHGHGRETLHQTASEAIYGMARVDVGGGSMGGLDGAVGAWAAKAITTLGTLSRDIVGPYDGQRAREWGARGVPRELEEKAGAHKVQTCSLVTTWTELEDALANGYPVTVCSNQGFAIERDSDGFCQAQGAWAHCMLLCGVRADQRPGACIFQSWGSKNPRGPLGLDQPPNSFWAERSVVERMLSLRDSWSLSTFQGYPERRLPDRWTLAGFA